MKDFSAFVARHTLNLPFYDTLLSYLESTHRQIKANGYGEVDPHKSTLQWIDLEASKPHQSLDFFTNLTTLYARVRVDSDEQASNPQRPSNLLNCLQHYTKPEDVDATAYTPEQLEQLTQIIKNLRLDAETKKRISKHVIAVFKADCEMLVTPKNGGLTAYIKEREATLQYTWEETKTFVSANAPAESVSKILSKPSLIRNTVQTAENSTSAFIKKAMPLAIFFPLVLSTGFIECLNPDPVLTAIIVASVIVAISIIASSSVAIHHARMKRVDTQQLDLFKTIINSEQNELGPAVTGKPVTTTGQGI